MPRERKVKTVGCKVTLEQFGNIVRIATQREQTVGEWVRDVLLQSITAQQSDLKTELLLSEMSAIRASMMMLMQHSINGTKITEQDLDAIIADSDRERFTIGASRFREGAKILAPVLKRRSAQ